MIVSSKVIKNIVMVKSSVRQLDVYIYIGNQPKKVLKDG